MFYAIIVLIMFLEINRINWSTATCNWFNKHLRTVEWFVLHVNYNYSWKLTLGIRI